MINQRNIFLFFRKIFADYSLISLQEVSRSTQFIELNVFLNILLLLILIFFLIFDKK